MTNAYDISGLVKKRADLAAELHELEQRAEQPRAGIAHLDAVLTMMEPGKPEEPRSRQYRPEWFGNLGRLVLEALRDAPEPLTSMQVGRPGSWSYAGWGRPTGSSRRWRSGGWPRR